jgi:hypothetical protein
MNFESSKRPRNKMNRPQPPPAPYIHYYFIFPPFVISFVFSFTFIRKNKIKSFHFLVIKKLVGKWRHFVVGAGSRRRLNSRVSPF